MASDDTRTPRRETGLTQPERSLRARIAVATSWANTDDWSERTAAARANGPGQLAYWENQVDPAGTMDPTLRAKRAEALRSAHFSRLSLAASKARRAKRTGK